jgi:hypothetical protein
LLSRTTTPALVRGVRSYPAVRRSADFSTILIALGLTACGNQHAGPGDAAASDGALVDVAPDASGPRSLALRFERAAGAQAFDAIATVDWPGGPAMAAVQITADHGSLGAPTTSGLETRVHLTPPTTGNYTITAQLGGLTTTKVAVVLGQVDDAWGQPEAVRGLVNTPGWEDGPSISPDGTVLTLQYLPVPINCLLGMDPSAAACHVKGPISGPARPNMPGASRVNADGTYVNGCPSLGVPSLPTPLPPDALYAFHRNADDSFSDPHPIYYAGSDGCISAFGLQLLDAAGDAVYAFDDPRHQGVGARLFRTTLDASKDQVLGTFSLVNGQLELDQTGQASIGDPSPIQGNPNEFRPPTGGVLLFSDDENVRQDLFVNSAASEAGPWLGEQLIPPPISDPTAQESQPFFDGHTLWFRRDLTVLATDWNGGPMTSASSWTTPRTILAPGTETTTGTIAVVGEPSVAIARSPRELYFVYARVADDGTLDLDVGMVPARE